MKKIITFFLAGVAISALSAGFAGCSAQNGENLSDEQRRIELAKLTDEVYYVAGYHSNGVRVDDYGNANAEAYLFISENLRDSVAVYNLTKEGEFGKLLDGIYELPTGIMSRTVCGYVLFPEEYRYEYPVKINSHRPWNEDEPMLAPCLHIYLSSNLSANKYIVVESLSKTEKP